MTERTQLRLSIFRSDGRLRLEFDQPGHDELRDTVDLAPGLPVLASNYARRYYVPEEADQLIAGLGAIFDGRIGAHLRAALDKGPCRLALVPDPGVAGYPWEIASFDGVQLWKTPGLSVVRSAPSGGSLLSPSPKERMNFLHGSALTAGPRPDVAERDLMSRLVADLDPDAYHTITSPDPMDAEWLEANLSRADVVQISAHGSLDEQGALFVAPAAGASGAWVVLRGSELAQLFENADVRMAIIVSCWSATAVVEEDFQSLVQAVSEAGVPIVIGMQSKVSTGAARSFLEALYASIASDDDLDAAVSAGRNAVVSHHAGLPEAGVPVVYSRLSGSSIHRGAAPSTVEPPEASLEPVREPAPRSDTRIFQVPFAQSRLFQARNTELDRIMFSLEQVQGREVDYSVVAGMGGIGKSRLACELAYLANGTGTADIIWWLRADDTETLIDDLGALGLALGLPTTDDRRLLAESAKRRLEETDARWLLIVDNAHTASSIEPWLPKVGPGQVVVTSRSRPGWLSLGTVHDLQVFDEDSSVAFLLAHLSSTGPDDKELAAELADELGHLPIALAQAGAYLSSMGTLEHLLGRVRRGARFLGRELPEAKSCWALFAEMFEVLSPDAITILRVAAWLDGDAIPRELFAGDAMAEALGCDDPDDAEDAVDNAIGALMSLGMISLNRDDGTLAIHRLVQQYTREVA